MSKNSSKIYKAGFNLLKLASKVNDFENIKDGKFDKVVKKHTKKIVHKNVNSTLKKLWK